VEEFSHALQDRHFDLRALGLDYTGSTLEYADSLWALSALIEGDAELVQEQYMEEYLTPAERDLLEAAYANDSYSGLSYMPRAVREALLFPYTYGRDFVAALFQRGGWEAVNAAYAEPPISSEQILHPEAYLAGEQPVPISLPALTDVLGDDWSAVYNGPAGEFFVSLYLGALIDADDAADAAEGWGGDRVVAYQDEQNDQVVLLLHTVWDSVREATEFRRIYDSYGAARFGYPADTESDDRACWYGADTLCVMWGGDSTTIILGPDTQTVEAVEELLRSDLY
jgi:hypothetical protein